MDNVSPPNVIEAQVEPSTLDFPQAMKAVIQGNLVARKEWANTDYCLLANGWLTIFRNGEFHSWVINDGDMLATDWIILKRN